MRQPGSLQLARAFLVINAFLWLVFAAIVAAGQHPSYPPSSPSFLPMAAGSLLGALVLAVIAWLLRKPGLSAYWIALGVLCIALLACLLDDIGYADLVPILLTAAPLTLLIRNRSWFAPPSGTEGGPKRAA